MKLRNFLLGMGWIVIFAVGILFISVPLLSLLLYFGGESDGQSPTVWMIGIHVFFLGFGIFLIWNSYAEIKKLAGKS